MSDGHTLTQSNIHNSYGGIVCIWFYVIISAIPNLWKSTPLFLIYLKAKIRKEIDSAIIITYYFFQIQRNDSRDHDHDLSHTQHQL